MTDQREDPELRSEETQVSPAKTIHCVCCGNEVQLQRDEHNRSLQVGCGCTYRSVKVKEALPWDWNHD